MEFISDRMSVQRSKDRLSVVISGKIEPWKEALLFAWVVAWTACGVYFMYSFFNAPDRDTKSGMVVMLAFWVYFELRIGKALLWRKFGKEMIRLKDGVFSIKNDIKGYGKAREVHWENIEKMGLIEANERSFKWQMTHSFWVVGAETLQFKALGKTYIFGKGLADEEARELLKILKSAMKAQRSMS